MAIKPENLSVSNRRSRIPAAFEKPLRSALAITQIRGKVSIGKRARLSRGALITSWHGLSVGHTISVGERSVIEVNGSIGNFCLIGRNVQILGKLDHGIDEIGIPIALSTWVGDREPIASDSVHIGDDVWIGANALIIGGVRIGHGAIIGAGSVVTKNIPDFGIAVGNPARVLRLRFANDNARAEHLRLIREICTEAL